MPSPIQDIAKIIEADSKLSRDAQQYGFNLDDNGKKRLRRFQRFMHGYPEDKADGDIRGVQVNAPLLGLAAGLTYNLTCDSNGKLGASVYVQEVQPLGGPHLIDGQDIQRRQQQVEVWYDPLHIKPEQVEDILRYKGGTGIWSLDGQKEKELEQLASYVVIRGEVKQYHDNKGNILDTPRPRIMYYSAFPKLQGKPNARDNSLDYDHFCENKALKPGTIHELKDKFKDIIKLQAMVAARHNEALDLVTPSAFFYGLIKPEQEEAKKLFGNAAIEAIKEIIADQKQYKEGSRFHGFQGLLIHNDTIDIPQELSYMLVRNVGDAGAPNLIASTKDHLKIPVAECIMGEALGGPGNGALSDKAERAKEENDTRVMGGEVQLIFNPSFNPRLDQRQAYITFPQASRPSRPPAKTSSPHPKSSAKSVIPKATIAKDIKDLYKELYNKKNPNIDRAIDRAIDQFTGRKNHANYDKDSCKTVIKAHYRLYEQAKEGGFVYKVSQWFKGFFGKENDYSVIINNAATELHTALVSSSSSKTRHQAQGSLSQPPVPSRVNSPSPDNEVGK